MQTAGPSGTAVLKGSAVLLVCQSESKEVNRQVRTSLVIPARLSLEGLQKRRRMEKATRSSCLAHHNSWMSSSHQWWHLT